MVRISGSGATGAIQKAKASGGKAAKAAPSGKKSSGGDRVQVSDAATLREMAHAMMADMPDVRLQRIEEIRDALESGTTNYSSKKVATQIVRNAMAEHSWE
ncbi:MAG: flagellar biosynthesis anti-sigma factor FlgM [Mariprofundaceae bacterium]|nr:flagellar biosynthesis anti-sigma factor FlgM [Mariprofundaceae bacterium]